MKWTVLILAGSRGPLDPVAQAAGVGHKAFAAINGRPMITYVVKFACGYDQAADTAVGDNSRSPVVAT